MKVVVVSVGAVLATLGAAFTTLRHDPPLDPAVQTAAYWDGYTFGTPPFPRITPPMTKRQLESACLSFASQESKYRRKDYVRGCVDAGMDIQNQNAGR